jgi:4-hydroxy-3-methylbut-2-en-1-yl diphosphate reductase
VRVEIDQKSGFCFGVLNAIAKADEILKEEGRLYSLGYMVHNDLEVERLNRLGLKTINHEEYFRLKNCKVLIRAHGEPPSTYEYARKNNITLIDATCPVVLKLQQRVKQADVDMQSVDGQIVILGHPGHAEVTGLTGQTAGKVIVVENQDDYKKFDLKRPVTLFSQTTKSVDEFKKIRDFLESNAKNTCKSHNTICRQVSNRVLHLREFASCYDVIIFVGGKSSSNAKVLYDVCKTQNERCYFISSPEEIHREWFINVGSAGICGATSTPQWLMEQVAAKIKQF